MTVRSIIFICILACVGCSCKKEIIPDEPPYIDQWWDEYYGTYTVFDTMNDLTYQMEIKQIGRYFDGNLISDSVLIKNVANRFDIKEYFVQNSIYHGGIGFTFANPIQDVEGNQWAFSAGLGKKENPDTLELQYTLSNIAYYLEDGVPYYACDCVDLAIKNE